MKIKYVLRGPFNSYTGDVITNF